LNWSVHGQTRPTPTICGNHARTRANG